MNWKPTVRSISLALAATLAGSATTVTFDLGGSACANIAAGTCTSLGGAQQIDFDSAEAPSPFVSGNASFSFSPGNVSPFVSGSLDGQYAAPPGDQTQYLSIATPGRASSVIIDFDSPINYYGLYLGSPDAYNSFTFYGTGDNVTPVASFTGNDIIPPGNGNQSIGQYVNFYANGGTVSRIVLASTQAALESDNHAYVLAPGGEGDVPEPATMGLMGTALASIGILFRRRKAF
jgi:hypothetical protein